MFNGLSDTSQKRKEKNLNLVDKFKNLQNKPTECRNVHQRKEGIAMIKVKNSRGQVVAVMTMAKYMSLSVQQLRALKGE